MTKKPRILLIEDDDEINAVLAMGMEFSGFETRSALNGVQAVEAMKAEAFDVVLVDLLMPEMDGIRFLRWLREEARSPVPAIVLSSSSTSDLVQEAMRAGANAFVAKPVTLPELVKAVEEVLRGAGG